ncbi:MAG: DUF5060 domain-containing protein [bacterium]
MKTKLVLTIIGVILMSSIIQAAKAAPIDKIAIYSKYEIQVDYDVTGINPYNYDKIYCQAVVTSPDNRTFVLDGFYSTDFDYSYATNVYAEKNGSFKVRIAPWKTGKWKYFIKIMKDNKEVYKTVLKSFVVEADKNKKGFLRVSKTDPLFLEFDNKDSFFGIGMNLAWFKAGGLLDYKDWLKKMKDNGANLTRIWMAPWSLGIEWDSELENYGARQKQAFMLDKILEMAGDNEQYVMLTLVPHGEFSSIINPEWEKSPYNIKNNGLLKTPEDFFTNSAAKKVFKNKLRYIIARWGFSDRIMAWELFNEVDLTDNYKAGPVSDWHSEMLDYMKAHDTYRHLLTTSFSSQNKDPEIWNLSQIDIIQTHIYNLRDEAEQIYEACKNKIDNYAKPHIVSEYGIDAGNDFITNKVDITGIHMHNAMWAGAFTLSMGAPMQWYWAEYTDRLNLYPLFRPLQKFTKDINWDKESFNDLQEKDVYYKKTAEDAIGGAVTIFPVDVWGKAQKDDFVIKSDGTIINKDYFNAFLFGKSKPELKTIPVLSMKNENPSKMIIKLNKVSADNELRVSINNIQVLSVTVNAESYDNKEYMTEWKIYQADINTEYVVALPAGDNEIMLENMGSDWIKIESIQVENFLSAALAPVFVSGVQGKKATYIWLKNKDYSYRNPSPPAIPETYMNLKDFLPGRYVIEFYDTYEGVTISSKDYIVDEDSLRLDIPEIQKDIAVSIKSYKK